MVSKRFLRELSLGIGIIILALLLAGNTGAAKVTFDKITEIDIFGRSIDVGIEQWKETTALKQSMSAPYWAGKQSIIHDGRIYVFGGQNSTDRLTNVYYSTITPGGSIGAWQETTSLPGEFFDHVVVKVENHVYLITGANGAVDVYYASIESNGSIGKWIATTPIYPSRQNFAAISYGNFIYVSGGNAGGTRNSVKFTSVKPDGSLNTWNDTTSLPEDIEGHTMATNNGYLYVLAPNSTVYYSHINSNGTISNWTKTTPLPQPMYRYSTFIHNGYLFLLGGSSNAAIYNQIRANGSLGNWRSLSPLPSKKMGLWAGAYGRYLYAIGGYNGSSYEDTVYYAKLYGNWINWINMTPMPVSVNSFGYSGLNGKIYIIGGEIANKSTTTVQRYTPSTDTWEVDRNNGGTLAPLPEPRSFYLSGGVINGRIHIIGGWENGSYRGNHFIYNPENNTWSTGPSIPDYPIGQFSATVNNKIYVFGGWWGNYRNTVYEYSEEKGWLLRSPMPTARNHGTAAVYNGSIYVIGGSNGPGATTNFLDVVEKYDPISDTWTGGFAPMPRPNSYMSSAGSPVLNGIIYVLGPGNSSFGYDPQDDVWVTFNPMPAEAWGIDVIEGSIYAMGPKNTFLAGIENEIYSCTTISIPGSYRLARNITNSSAYTCINIISSDVVLDGGGHMIDGTASSNNVYGVYVHGNVNNVTIKNLKVNEWVNGISMDYSRNSLITGNTATSNSQAGISLFASDNNTVEGNAANSNWNGIWLYTSSDYNMVSNNNVSNNFYGIALYVSNSNNTISRNNAINNNYGIHLSTSSNYNTVSNNKAISNNYSISLVASNNNIIYNNYFNSNNFSYDDGNNIWNITKTAGMNIIGGPYLGGNYWSDYTGNDTDWDGLGDTLLPYNSSGNIKNGGDMQPLVKAAPPLVYVNPSYQTSLVDSNFTVDIMVDPQGTYVYAAQYRLMFDAGRLEALSQIQGTFLRQDGNDSLVIVNNIDNTAGSINYSETRMGTNSGVKEPGILASIQFRARAGAQEGNTTLDLSEIVLSDPQPSQIPNVIDRDGIVNITRYQPPVVNCGPDRSKCENINSPVHFDGSASYDPDGTIVSYAWEFGDGTTGTGVAPRHTYTGYRWNGTAYQPFIANLTVADNTGLTNTTSQKVIIWIAGDANGDGRVNILDASRVGIYWGSSDPCADLNNDGKANVLDAALIGLNWGRVP